MKFHKKYARQKNVKKRLKILNTKIIKFRERQLLLFQIHLIYLFCARVNFLENNCTYVNFFFTKSFFDFTNRRQIFLWLARNIFYLI